MKVLSIIIYILVLVHSSLELRISYHCPTPKIANGRIRLRQKSKFVKYVCNPGFLLSGDKYSTCVHGEWDGPPPKCVRPGCRKVNPTNNISIFASHMNAVLHFFCTPGFELRGPDVTHCNSTTWSYNSPTCLPSNTKPALSCDFERADLCGWTHDLNHDFDWRRMQFNTPSGSIGTGPSFDHTYGEDKGGYYMYIESSSRNENDKARLISPVYDKTVNDTCFQFFYHMYGATIGSLRVYLKLFNESSIADLSKPFFEKRGNHGNRWLEYVHKFGPIQNDYQIIFEGTRGSSYVSDIAIDDVRIIENCNLEELKKLEMTSTTEMEEYSTTDFLPDDLYSCENRCSILNITMGKHRKCACDDYCYDRNDCCPDFIDFCVLHGYSTDSESIGSTTISTSSTTTAKRISKTTTTTTEKPIRTTTPHVLTEISTKDKNLSVFTWNMHPRTRITTEGTYTRSTPGSMRTTESKSTNSTTSTSTRPTIRTTTTTSTTRRPTMQTTTRTTTTKRPTTMRTTTITSTTKRPTTTTATTKTAISTENNKIDESTAKREENRKLLTTVDLSNDILKIPNDMVPIEDVAHLKRNYNQKIIILQTKEENNLPVYLGCGAAVLMICVVVIVVVGKRIRSRSRGFRSASRGDSTSDVRFLTSDEFLDFNVDYK